MTSETFDFLTFQIVHDGEFVATPVEWKGKDDASTALRTSLSILEIVSTAAASYGQLAPDPFQKGIAGIVVGAVSAGSSTVEGVLAARNRALS